MCDQVVDQPPTHRRPMREKAILAADGRDLSFQFLLDFFSEHLPLHFGEECRVRSVPSTIKVTV
jgi:hypothetical protein